MKNNAIKKILAEFFSNRPEGYNKAEITPEEKQKLIELGRKYGLEENVEDQNTSNVNEDVEQSSNDVKMDIFIRRDIGDGETVILKKDGDNLMPIDESNIPENSEIVDEDELDTE